MPAGAAGDSDTIEAFLPLLRFSMLRVVMGGLFHLGGVVSESR